MWHRDEVQTSRILFYLRVMPTCVGLIPARMIRDKVASIMFLYPFYIILLYLFFLLCLPIFSIRTLWSLARTRYLQHPNEKVNSASHSVMVSFLPSSTDTDQDDRTSLKEQLAFYYIKRSLEVVHAKYCFVIFGS
jgi:hypothetical protein